MRVAHDHLGRVAGVVDQNFLRGDEHVHGMAVGGNVECPVGREFQQVQAGQVAAEITRSSSLALYVFMGRPSRMARVEKSVSRMTAYMKSSVTRTELLA